MDKSTLESHMETRKRLMRAVLEARALHGLPPIDPFVLRAVDDETPKKEDQA